MTDELTTPTPDEDNEQTPVEESPKVELNDELVAEYLGVDPEFFTKEVKPQATGLNKLYAKLNNERAKQGRTPAPQPAAAPAADDGDGDWESLDDRSKRIIAKAIAEQTAPLIQMLNSTMESSIENVVDEFSRTHTDVPANLVNDAMEEFDGWSVSTPAQLKKNLERAYKLARADYLDPEAEVNKRLAERLAAAKSDDAEVVEVKPKRKPQDDVPDENTIVNNDDVPWYKKMEMFS